MSGFQNILVGIDLTQCPRLSADALPPIVQDVFQRSVWLARKTGGRLTFLSALNLPEEILLMWQEKHALVPLRRIEAEAGEVLADLARRAQKEGVPAAGVLAHGRGAVELTRQVRSGNHDLVLVGTRHAGAVGRMLFGSVAVKLLRHCPCPVWVSRPEPLEKPLNVLVASDLCPVSELALRLAVRLAEQTPATLHVLHVLEYPHYQLWLTALPEEAGPEGHGVSQAEAARLLQAQLERTEYRRLSSPVQLHLAARAARPDEAILQFIADHAIDLLVMGTAGHGEIPSVLIGNTAERLFAEVPCSVLAVKSQGLQGPDRPVVGPENGAAE